MSKYPLPNTIAMLKISLFPINLSGILPEFQEGNQARRSICIIRACSNFKYFVDMADSGTSDVNLREAVTCQTSLFVCFVEGEGRGVNRTEIVGA